MTESVKIIDASGRVSQANVARLVVLLILSALVYMAGTSMYSFFEEVVKKVFPNRNLVLEAFVILATSIILILLVVYVSNKIDPTFNNYAAFSPL